jgi:hypothetical protein
LWRKGGVGAQKSQPRVPSYAAAAAHAGIHAPSKQAWSPGQVATVSPCSSMMSCRSSEQLGADGRSPVEVPGPPFEDAVVPVVPVVLVVSGPVVVTVEVGALALPASLACESLIAPPVVAPPVVPSLVVAPGSVPIPDAVSSPPASPLQAAPTSAHTISPLPNVDLSILLSPLWFHPGPRDVVQALPLRCVKRAARRPAVAPDAQCRQPPAPSSA